jgi:hypothetical protein
MNKILSVVDAVLDSVGKIAAGAIGDAANWIESALARTVAPVIGFFADWVGIDSPGEKLAEVVKGIQDRVDGAMDFLIEKAKGLFGGKDKKEEEEDPKWKAGVAGVTKDLEKHQQDGLTEDEIKASIPGWKSAYGFSELELKLDGDEFDIVGSMSPSGRLVAKASGDNPTEGLAGTYDALQGSKGDKMTPDHEPQHALMSYVSDLTVGRFQGFRKPFKGTPVEGYTKGEGICLNMFQDRHYKTRTYGASPAPAIAKIRDDLDKLPDDAPVEKVQKTVKKVVNDELAADQGVVKDIYSTANVPPKTKARVTKGLGEVKSQNSRWWP